MDETKKTNFRKVLLGASILALGIGCGDTGDDKTVEDRSLGWAGPPSDFGYQLTQYRTLGTPGAGQTEYEWNEDVDDDVEGDAVDDDWDDDNYNPTPVQYDQTEVWTHASLYDPSFPYIDATGEYLTGGATNLLTTQYANRTDVFGREMPHTLPSIDGNPYNVHIPRNLPGEDQFGVTATEVDQISQTTDLMRIFRIVRARAENDGVIEAGLIKYGLNVLEGRPLIEGLTGAEIGAADDALGFLDASGEVTREYVGFPVLHYINGSAERTKKVHLDEDGKWVVDVKQLWFDSHIESDTTFVDLKDAKQEPWYVNYDICILDRGEDDFAPFAMYFNRGKDSEEPDFTAEELAANPRFPHIGLDASFFPMHPGKCHQVQIGMAPGKYYKLTYHWGWRVHPPRVQAIEKASNAEAAPIVANAYTGEFARDENGNILKETKTLPEWERAVFGDPDVPGYDRRAVIEEQIGDRAPAKRMWKHLLAAESSGNAAHVAKRMKRAEKALWEWFDRTKLPKGIKVDNEADLTIIYLNNTIYGEWKDKRELFRYFEFQTREGNEMASDPNSLQIKQRGDFKVAVLNGDRYVHAYVNVDFGGARGWENHYGPAIPYGGPGAWFSFGRANWWPTAGAGPQTDPVTGAMGPKDYVYVRPVERNETNGKEKKPGKHMVTMHLNFEPSRRLRMYQFDPLHHDVAIFSLH